MYVSDESSDLGDDDLGLVYSDEARFCGEKESNMSDDDSLSKMLRGLDFDEPLFGDDDMFKLDRTQTTDGDCTLSYSSFTY